MVVDSQCGKARCAGFSTSHSRFKPRPEHNNRLNSSRADGDDATLIEKVEVPVERNCLKSALGGRPDIANRRPDVA
jgi:hypothetical protein